MCLAGVVGMDGVCPSLTISEERLRQLAEESLEQAADHVEVLPALRRSREIRTHACSSQVPWPHVPYQA